MQGRGLLAPPARAQPSPWGSEIVGIHAFRRNFKNPATPRVRIFCQKRRLFPRRQHARSVAGSRTGEAPQRRSAASRRMATAHAGGRACGARRGSAAAARALPSSRQHVAAALVPPPPSPAVASRAERSVTLGAAAAGVFRASGSGWGRRRTAPPAPAAPAAPRRRVGCAPAAALTRPAPHRPVQRRRPCSCAPPGARPSAGRPRG